MGAARFIAEHPLIVIAAWIIIVILAAPLFAQLHKVVKTTQFSLPPHTEARIAEELLKKVKGAGGSPAVIIVEGPDLRDNHTLLKLIEWGYEYNKTFHEKHLGSNLVSVPVMLARLNESLYKAMLRALNASSTGAREAYRALLRLNETFLKARENFTRMVWMLENATTGLMKADEGYSAAYKGLRMLVNATEALVKGIRMVELAVVNATNRFEALAENVNRTAYGLSLLDLEASRFAHKLLSSAKQLLTVLSNKTLDEMIEKGLALEWWQVSRAYRYLEAFNGNYTLYVSYTNLTRVNPAFAPLPRKEALEAWMSVRTLIERGVDADTAALLVAAKWYNSTLARMNPAAARLLPVYVKAFNASLIEAKREANITCLTMLYSLDPRLAAKTQLEVLGIVENAAAHAAESIAANAGRITVGILSELLKKRGIPADTAEKLALEAVESRLNPLDVYRVVARLAAAKMPELRGKEEQIAALLAHYDPGINAVLARNWSLAVNASTLLVSRIAAEKGIQIPSKALQAIARLVEKNETSRARIAAVAYKLVAEMLRERMPRAATLAPIIEAYDPEAEGILARNATLLKNVVLKVLYQEAGEKISRLPRSLVEEIVSSVVEGRTPTDEELLREALRLVIEEASRRLGAERAKAIASLLERYDPEARGVIAANKTLAAIIVAREASKEASKRGFNVTSETLATLILHPEKANEVFCRMFREQALKHAPPEARMLVEEAVEMLCEKGRLTSSDMWSLVRKAIARSVEERARQLPRWVAEFLVNESLAVARNETSLAAAARLLATRILFREVVPKVLNETRGMLVASNLKGFLVMFTPSGSTSRERSEATLEAARLVNRTLRSYVTSLRVYATGRDLLMTQVREYAIHDTEKTSKISEAATFIVLLAILESVFAVLLPYIGIGLGVILGGALVYLGAKFGILEVSNEAQALMITTALGLGADYAGYLVHRFREEMAIEHNPKRAVEVALKTAGPAIVASALTVIIGFASLLLGWDIAFLRSLGEVIPVAVAATAFASLTLVPALLALLGGRRWFWWPRKPSLERHVGKISRVARALVRHHWAVLAVLLALFAVAGYFYVNFHGSHDMKLMLPSNAEAVKAFKVLREQYMPGITDPVFVVYKLPHSIFKDKALQEYINNVASRLEALRNVGKVLKPNATSGFMVSSDGRIAALEVILSVDPYSREGESTVKKIHDLVHQLASDGIRVYVGGAPYAILEMDDVLHNRFYYRILPAASLLMIAVFTIIFGALPASIAALAVIIGAAMTGIMIGVLLFQWLLGEPILWFMHVVALVAVMGVGMDYNSFFLARALEECQKTNCDTEKAIPRAVGAVGLFILGLSVVVASAYLSMLVSSNVGMQEMGFILGVTILLAGIMASYLFTPLVIAMMGRSAWWPRGMKKKVVH